MPVPIPAWPRNSAFAVLDDLVTCLDGLEPVDSISEIYINPNFDAVLEQRFIEYLKKMSGVASVPPSS